MQSNFIKSDALLSNLGLAIKIALDFGVRKSVISKTIPKIKFEGRVQYVKKGNFKKMLYKNEKLLVDGCHSISSGENLYNYLKTLKGPIYGIWGMQRNKIPDKFIGSFNNIFKKIYTIKIPNEPNALNAHELKKISEKFNNNTETALNVKNAIKKISNKKNKTIVIFGSLYLIGDLLKNN